MGKFAYVARVLANDVGDQETVWSHLDQDSNGAVNWPEFVEWAETNHVSLEVGGGGGDDGQLSFPSSWKGPKDNPEWVSQYGVADAAHFRELSELLQVTYKNVWTRDRKKTGVNKVPVGYDLVSAKRCENFRDWRRYYLKRHQLAHACSTRSDFVERRALSSKATALCKREGLRTHCNEWLLFHGTSQSAAESILTGAGDFTMSLAGTATGTLYGRGTYFAESITKADEYAKEEDGICCVLVCRIVGGHVLYNDEVTPDAEELQRACLAGESHSILGDREKCRNTFKEYIIFDADQVYVEYVLCYTRRY